MGGHYDEDGTHICVCGQPTRYQSMSGGKEYWCDKCEDTGRYPEGEGGPRAREFAKPNGPEQLRELMIEEMKRRKDEKH